MPVQREVDLHKGAPLGSLGFAHKVHASLRRSVVRFAGIARDAGTNNVFPRGRTTTIARNNVVEVQLASVKHPAAILAGVFIAFKNIVPGKFDFLFRHPVVHEQQNDARHANAKGDGMNEFFVRSIGGNIAPFLKTEGAERAVWVIHHDLRLTLKKQSESAAGGANIHRLPEPVQHQNVLIQRGFHGATGTKLAKQASSVNRGHEYPDKFKDFP